MDLERLQRTLIILLILAALTFLVEKALRVAALFGNTILLFALAWLLSFTLSPLVAWMSREQGTGSKRQDGGSEGQEAGGKRQEAGGEARIRERARLWPRGLPRPLAVVLVYLGLLLVLGLTGLVVAPAAASQLYQLGLRLPEYAYTLPDLVTRWQADLARLGLDVDLTDALRSQELIRRAQDVGAYLVQNLVTIAAGVANLLANLFIILILSFYMTLDGPALSRRALELVPPDWRDEARVLRRSWTAPSAASCVGSSSRAPFSAWVPW